MNLHKILNVVVISSMVIGLASCSGDSAPEEPQQQVRQTPKPSPRPKVKTVAQLQKELDVDERIYLDEKQAPRKAESRQAVLKFFNAFLNVDRPILQNMLSFSEQLEVDAMIEAGLSDMMDKVTFLELKTGTSPEGKECALAIYEIGMDYQVQVWYFENKSGPFTFTAAETPPNLVNRLSGDWLASYFALKEKQTELANQPDSETSYALAGETTSSSGSLDTNQPKAPSGPLGPGGPGKGF